MDHKIAVNIYFNINDRISTDFSAIKFWNVTQKVSQLIGYLGILYTCRKKIDPSHELREWVGTSVDSSKYVATVFVSTKKWKRSEKMILRITKKLEEGNGLNFKILERDRGYLIYISRTYR